MTQIDSLLDRASDYVSHNQPILPGSSLDADDKIFDVLPVSALAWHGISSATDHLGMFMDAVKSGQSRPLAPQTLARTGMVSAAHALWLLDGKDRRTRQQRAIRLAYFEFSEDHKAVQEMATYRTSDPVAARATLQTYLYARRDWMNRAVTVGASLGMTIGQVTTLNDTDLLDAVCKDIGQRRSDDPEIFKAVRTLWRMYSGIAHGLRWPLMTRVDLSGSGQADSTGTIRGQVINDLSELTMAASGIAIFLLNALNLFEVRRKPAE